MQPATCSSVQTTTRPAGLHTRGARSVRLCSAGHRRVGLVCIASQAGAKSEAKVAATRPPPTPLAPPATWPTAAARASAFGSVGAPRAEGVEAAITGRLPPWLSGKLIRNGPGEFTGKNHWFDGYALLASFELDGPVNRVVAGHRFLESRAYQHWRRSGGVQRWREFGTPIPPSHPLARLRELGDTLLGAVGLGEMASDNAGVNFIRVGPHLVAVTETAAGTWCVDPDALVTLGRLQYADTLSGLGDMASSHPNLLPNGDRIGIYSGMGKLGAGLTLTRQPAADPLRREALAFVPHRHPLAGAPYIHSFGSTPGNSILPEGTLHFSLPAVLAGREDVTRWRPQDGARMHVVSHATGEVRTFDGLPPFFCLHVANAFESPDGRFVSLDAAVYDDAQAMADYRLAAQRADYATGRDIAPCRLRRMTIDLQAPPGAPAVSGWEPLVDDDSAYGSFVEMPNVNPRHRCLPYRFCFAIAALRPANMPNSFVRFDLQERSCKVLPMLGSVVGEPIFVPTPGAAREEEGAVVATLVQPDGRAALVVIDGQRWEEVARAQLPYGLPVGFHAAFLPRE